MDYTLLSLPEIRIQVDALAREADANFGALDARQLNWRPAESRWSVAQCFAHLLKANQLMFQAMDHALNEAHPATIWQRMPIVPTLFGQLLIRSQSPSTRGKYSAPRTARPGTSDIAPDIIEQFVEEHRDALRRLETIEEQRASRTVMTSPFIRIVVYSVLDGWRLIVAHDWRHVEQARRVTLASGFPPAA